MSVFARYRLNFLALLFLVTQILFSAKISDKIKFNTFITSNPPSNAEIVFYGLGDKNFSYRFFSQRLQMMGDGYGNIVPLSSYDFDKLILWFNKIQQIDPKSRYLPYIAGFYYAFSQNKQHSRYVIDFLIDRFNSDPDNNWEWLLHATYLTKYRLEDKDLESQIIRKINNLGKIVPRWGRLMLALILVKDDKSCESLKIIDSFTADDLQQISRFMGHGSQSNDMFFILKNRIHKILADKEFVRSCLQ